MKTSTATAQNQTSPIAMPTTGTWLVASHPVANFERWKAVFDETAAIKRRYGWKQSSVFAIDGNRNNVLVMEEFDSIEQAKAFASSPDLKAAMGKAGVLEAPQIRFVSGVATATA